MKNIILTCTFLILAFNSALAKDKKPKLENGLYAEIETNKGKILLQLN